MTLKDSHKFTFSPGSVDGRSRYVALEFLIADLSGQPLALASLSARQAKVLGLLTSGTYGPPHIGLSASAALSWSLASNLAALTRMTGSTLYKLTWKPWAMPSGRLRFRLRASARRTKETVLIGWPTPIASNGRGAGNFNRQGGVNLQTAVLLTGWPTPTTIDNNQVAGAGAAANAPKRGTTLGGAARLAGWPTPTATDGKGGYQGGQGAERETVNGQAGRDSAACRVADANNEQRPIAMSARGYADVSRQWNKDSEAATGCSGAVRPGPVNGFWRDTDWLHSQDGKWRPVRPGSFPLADGVPARVGRLRAYGNAINIEAATAFIKSYMAAVDYV